MRELLNSLKFKQDFSKNQDFIQILDPMSSGFITSLSFSRILHIKNPEILYKCFKIKENQKITCSNFIKALRDEPLIRKVSHIKSSNSLSFVKSKDFRDLEYNSYLEKHKEIKNSRGIHENYASLDTNQIYKRMNFTEPKKKSNERNYKLNLILNKPLNFTYNTQLNIINNGSDMRNWTERKFYSNNIIENMKTTQKNQFIDKNFISPTKEQSKSYHESQEKFVINQNFTQNYIIKNDNSSNNLTNEKIIITNIDNIEKKNDDIVDHNDKNDQENKAEIVSQDLTPQNSRDQEEINENHELLTTVIIREPELNGQINELSNRNQANSSQNNDNDDKIPLINQLKESFLIPKDLAIPQNTLKVPEKLSIQRKSSGMIYESLILCLEQIYKQMKEKIIIYHHPIIYLMICGLQNEDIGIFFKQALLQMFEIKSFAIYKDNKLRSIYEEELEEYERIKRESLLMSSFSIGDSENLEKSGLFIHKLGENNEEIIIIYKINQPSEDNIMYLYFQLLEKYNFSGFKEHLAKFILIIDNIVNKVSNVEVTAIVKELLTLIKYFIVNFKALFLEHIKKILTRTFELDM